MRRPRARVLPLLLVALVASAVLGCTSDGDTEATPEPFVPVSRAVETEAGVLVLAYDNIAAALSSAARLDAETLDVLSGEVPIHQGGPIDPTGQWIAAFEPRGNFQLQNVRVYDLETWELAWSVSGLPRGELSWQPGGLYLWGEHCEVRGDRGACPSGWDRGLWRLTPTGAEELVDFDFAPFVDSPAIARDGSSAYVVGLETDLCCGIATTEGDPFLAILDLDAGTVEERIPLPGLRIGQPGDWLGSTDHLGAQYLPGFAVSPDETIAYLVHAEVDEVAVIDLDLREVVARHSLAEDDSAVADLGGWLLDRFARSAEAKGVAEYLRNVQLTPDGRYLLVSGTTVEETPDEVAPGAWVDGTVAGLIAVDVTTMEVVYRDDTAGAFALSPNGYSVLTWGPSHWEADRVGLRILDLRTMKARHLFERDLVGPAHVSPDGRYGYARIPEVRQAGRLVAFDLETGEVVAEHPLEQRGDMAWDWPRGLEFSP